MIYHSPINFIEDLGIDIQQSSNLKLIRQHQLLRFDLEGTTTIDIGKKKYDKALIIEMFEKLKVNRDFHIRVNNNKPLVNLLKTGNLDFFRLPRAWKDFEDDSFCDGILPYFISKMQEVIFQIVKEPGLGGLHLLLMIKRTQFRFPESSQVDIYSKAMNYYKSWIIESNQSVIYNTVDIKFRNVIDPEALKFFETYNYKKLTTFPDYIYQPLIGDIIKLAIFVVEKAFTKKKRFYRFDIDNLSRLRFACQLYYAVYPSDEALRKLINRIIKLELKSSEKHGLRNVFFGVLFTAFILLLIVYVSKQMT